MFLANLISQEQGCRTYDITWRHTAKQWIQLFLKMVHALWKSFYLVHHAYFILNFFGLKINLSPDGQCCNLSPDGRSVHLWTNSYLQGIHYIYLNCPQLCYQNAAIIPRHLAFKQKLKKFEWGSLEVCILGGMTVISLFYCCFAAREFGSDSEQDVVFIIQNFKHVYHSGMV